MTAHEGIEGETRTVAALMSEVRDLVNAPRARARLSSDHDAWLRLCSAMDAIEDADHAIGAHALGAWDQHGHLGARYLAHYGFLQAIYVQQDAVRSLCTVLGVPFDLASLPEVKQAREIRNDAVGHPTGRHDGSVHAIVQISIHARGFSLRSWAGGTSQLREVRSDEVARGQHKGMVVALSASVKRLRDADAEHRSKFSGQHLVGLLDADTGYALEKISVGARRMAAGECDPSDEAMARAGLDVLARIADTVRSALRERGEFPEVRAPTDYVLAEVTNAAATLGEVFAGQVEARHGQAYAHLLGSRLKELREVLAEVDAEYQAKSTQIAV